MQVAVYSQVLKPTDVPFVQELINALAASNISTYVFAISLC